MKRVPKACRIRSASGMEFLITSKGIGVLGKNAQILLYPIECSRGKNQASPSMPQRSPSEGKRFAFLLEKGISEIQKAPSEGEKGISEVLKAPSKIEKGIPEVPKAPSEIEKGISEVLKAPSRIEKGIPEGAK